VSTNVARTIGASAVALVVAAALLAPMLRGTDGFPALSKRDALPGLIPDPFVRTSGDAPVDAAYDTALGALLTAENQLLEQQDLALGGALADPAARETARAARNRAEGAVVLTRDARDRFYGFPTNHAAGYRGVLVQRDTLLVLFRRTPDPAAIESFLTRNRLTVRWKVDEIPLYVVEIERKKDRTWEGAATRLHAAAERIRKQTHIVEAVAENNLLCETVVPRSSPKPQSGMARDWFVSGGDPVINSGFPEAWNFNEAIGARGGRMDVTMLDVGFFDDVCDPDVRKPCDLRIQLVKDSACANPKRSHGTEMASIIAAGFDDVRGLDGASPFTTIHACAPEPPPPSPLNTDEEVIARRCATFERFIAALTVLLQRKRIDELNLINASIGYNWYRQNLVASTKPAAQTMVAGQGTMIRRLLARYPSALVVAAAGNECHEEPSSCNEPAVWSSPFNWAALAGPAAENALNVIVVEGLTNGGNRLPATSVGGNMLAIGDSILVIDRKDNQLGVTQAGTSSATALVSATVAMMLSAKASLTVSQIRTNLGVDSSRPLNAFSAVYASNPTAAEDLANLDGRGGVTDSDLRIFEDEYRQVLSGNITGDLNRDCQKAFHDDRFCRIDLNGDGVVTAADRALMLAACGGCSP
jgi:Subtilase family